MAEELLGFHHVFVPGRGESPRTLLLLHGTGGDERDLLPLGRTLDGGAALLGVRGKVLEGSAPRWFRRLAEGVFDEADLVRRTRELAEFVPRAAARHGFAADSVIAVGYSNGANIAASLLLLEPGTLAAAVLFRPMVPLVPPQPPSLQGTRVLVLSGRHDPLITGDHPKRLTDLLRDAGADVTLQWANAGHEIHADEVEVARAWLQDGRG
ncbi:MAG: alpha/beta hydrolase [Clostridia bacterium]|nr:alpha/beta hydrolase [Clostridia bacterium]